MPNVNKDTFNHFLAGFGLLVVFLAIISSIFFTYRTFVEEKVCLKEGIVTEIISIGDESTFVVGEYHIKQEVDELTIKQPYCLVTHLDRFLRPDFYWYANETLKAEFPIE